MNRQTLAILFALTFGAAQAQSCLPGGITFVSQAEVDNFPLNNPGCKTIEGNVYVLGSSVQNLNGLSQIEHIGGDLLISDNPQLASLDGLPKLKTIGGACRVQNNPLLTHLDGLANLSWVKGDFFYIGNNILLANIEGLAELDSVSGIFQVWGHPELTTLKGLGQLQRVSDKLAVFNNAKLAVLEGLDSLIYVGGDLRLENNPLLTDISSLNHPVTMQGALVITDNAALSHCAVKSVCDYLANPVTFVAISDNGNNCASVPTVQTACQTLDTESPFSVQLLVSPNPASHTLRLQGMPASDARIKVFSSTGILILDADVEAAQVFQWNVSDWPIGLYTLHYQGVQTLALRFLVAR